MAEMYGGYKPVILIVDDEQKNIQVLGTVLISSGYNVITAGNGRQALEKLEKINPDLIMLDIMMPVMDGIETCKVIKSKENLKEIPVIFLTAKVEKDDIIEGLRAGAVDYITKPFNQDELLCRVNTHVELVLSKRRLAEKIREANELIHIICHDLVNPIGSIGSLLSIIDDAEPFGSYKGIMEGAVKRCLSIVDLVRQMKAVEEGKHRIEMVRVNLEEVVSVSLEILSSVLLQKNITARVDIDKDVCVLAEKVSLTNSVISNLITNAVKFSDKASEININCEVSENRVRLLIKDNGIGMPEKLLKAVFDPSKATTRTGTGGESGTGFGLPLVKKFVEAYGGNISITSKARTPESNESGTTVIVELIRAL